MEDGKKANAKAKEKIMKILNDKLEQLKKTNKAIGAINNINNTAADTGGDAKPEKVDGTCSAANCAK